VIDSAMSRRRWATLSGALASCAVLVPKTAAAATLAPARQGKPLASADFLLPAQGPATFMLTGNERFFGDYSCFGEMDLSTGAGIGVLTASGGDRIVGLVSCSLDENHDVFFHFAWRDSVTFSDGTTYGNSGRFLKHRPAGLVVNLFVPNLVLAILILLLP
jgi:hypothetical protein